MKRFDRHVGPAAAGFIILLLLLMESCASIGNPSGGPRDERPPRFVNATPPPGSKDVPVDIDRIRITFDELVNVKDAFSKVIVSPPGKSTPRVSALGKSVNVQFSDSLLPNTTYTVDFADAIEDNNEGNPLESFSYTFSTGPEIDTLRIAGRVLSARALEPMQLKLVGLHRLPDENYPGTDADTVVPSPDPANFLESIHRKLFTEKFYRVARTDDRGRFSIEGLPAGKYRIYALDDANSDYLFTNPEEEVAFSDVILSPTSESSIVTDSIFNLRLGVLDTVVERRRTIFLPNDVILRSALTARKQQFIQKYERIDSTRINLIFNAPMKRMPEIEVLGLPKGKEWAVTERSLGCDTLSFWINAPYLIDTDTIRLAMKYDMLDSVQNYVVKADTLRFTTDRAQLRKAAGKAAADLRKQLEKQLKKNKKDNADEEGASPDSIIIPTPLLTVEFPGSPEVFTPLIFETATPLARLDSTGFHLEEKSDTVWKPIKTPAIIRDTLNPRRYYLGDKWDFGRQYRLTVDSLAIEGLYGLHNGTISHEFSMKQEKNYCSLILRLPDWPAGLPAFVELVNQSDNIAASAPLVNGVANFRYLNPGKYYARVVEDHNADGIWNPGDPLINLQPEAAYYNPKAINIKQNWNKDETWRVFDTPVDLMKPENLLKNKPTAGKNRNTKKKGNASGATEEEDEEEDY